MSESIAWLRDQDFVVTEVDSADHRRTLVREQPRPPAERGPEGYASVDAALAQAFDESDPTRAEVLVNTLNEMARRLLPRSPAESIASCARNRPRATRPND